MSEQSPVQTMIAAGADQVAGRLIYRGQDLAFWENGQWRITQTGTDFLAARTTVADGVEVVVTAQPVSRKRRVAAPAEDLPFTNAE